MSNSALAVCSLDDTVHVRVDGRAVAHDCPALRRHVEAAVRNGCRRIRIHLQRCEYFDSTFLGTLLCLQKFRAENEPVELRLVKPSGEADDILKRMGAAALFRSGDDSECPEQSRWVPCQSEPAGNCSLDFKHNVVQAHQHLADVDGPLGDTYRQIAEMAARDLEAAQNR